MYLDVYCNAQPVAVENGKPRAKPTNALMSTTIAYTGGREDFAIDGGSEVSLNANGRAWRASGIFALCSLRPV